MGYEPKEIEKKWQDDWQKSQIYHAKDDTGKPKKYILIEFPYPSGEGLHMGHLRPFVAGDVYSRFWRMQGYETMYPMGWDAFGLPAENFAIKNKVHPAVSTAKNIANAKRQLMSWGTSFDWSREINTTDPDYYKWTQWIFLQFFKAGLAYEATGLINWCPKDKTGLANEEVIDGHCERCGTKVEKKELRQWYLKITDYAEKLLAGLEDLDWPEAVKLQQKNWIGKSEGAEIDFEIVIPAEAGIQQTGSQIKSGMTIRVFTTRPDTLFGATYMVLAPEHPLVEKITTAEQKNKVVYYANTAKSKTDIERASLEKEKSGVFTGAYAINPATSEKIPIWIADYVLGGYGTGAIMAVPAHDERDFEFAKKFDLKIVPVIKSEVASYLVVEKSLKDGATEKLKDFGSITVQQVDPDWGKFFRVEIRENEQAFISFLKDHLLPGKWYADSGGSTNIVVFHGKEFDLAKNLFEYKEYGRSLGIPKEQLDAEGNKVFTDEGILINSAEYNGMDSAEAREKMALAFGTPKITYKLRDWVFSRQRYWGEPIPLIHCPKDGVVAVPDDQLPVKLPEVENYEPTGTGESPLAAIDEWVNVKCPKCGGPAKRETNTMPQWAGSSWYWIRYTDPKDDKEIAQKNLQKYWTPVDAYFGGMEHTTLHLLYARFWNLFLYDQKIVTVKEPFTRRIPHGIVLASDGEKMSKSRGNVVNPDVVVEKFGADTLRMYEMFLGPHTDMVSWNDQGIVGVKRFLDKVVRYANHPALDAGSIPEIHKLIKKITKDIEDIKFNTAVAAFMEFLNKNDKLNKNDWEKFLILLSPFAPHITEELWHKLGHNDSIHLQHWPQFDEKLAKDENAKIVIQINGKKKGTIEAPVGISQDELKKIIDSAELYGKLGLADKQKIKVIVVPDKLVNFVIKE